MSRLLIIPDIHQDLVFLSRIMEREDLNRFDRLILLGDYFDANSEAFAGEAVTRLTAKLLLELVEAFPRKVRLLWGNHDLIYCRLREYVLREDPEVIREQTGLGDLSQIFQRAFWINEVWPGEMWFRLEMAIQEDDWIFSHAGIHPDFWPSGATPASSLRDLLKEWEGVIGNLFENEDHPLVEAGLARGGQQPVGGPLWLDWDREFVDGLPYGQIIGHSADEIPRQKGRSWCIDCGQRAYGIVENGVFAPVILDLD